MLTLFWDDPNIVGYDRTDIYRKSSKNGEFVLLGSVTPNTTQFTDNNLPLINHVYWYRIVFVDEFMEPADSVQFPMGYFPDGTGPGSQDLLRGNWQLGYFGEVNVGLLPNFIDMSDALKFNTYPNVAPTIWHKFIAQGNIIYVPNQFIQTDVIPSADTLINNTPGEDRDDVVALVYKDGYNFSVRPPYADSSRRNRWVGFETVNLTTSENVKDSELAAVMSMASDDLLDVYGGTFKLVNDSALDNVTQPILTSTPGSENDTIAGRVSAPWVIPGNRLGTTPPTSVLPSRVFLLHILELLFD